MINKIKHILYILNIFTILTKIIMKYFLEYLILQLYRVNIIDHIEVFVTFCKQNV